MCEAAWSCVKACAAGTNAQVWDHSVLRLLHRQTHVRSASTGRLWTAHLRQQRSGALAGARQDRRRRRALLRRWSPTSRRLSRHTGGHLRGASHMRIQEDALTPESKT